jgi:nickel-dependent lactate racemase
VNLFLHMHALERMESRGITREEIQEALESPETTYPSADNPGATVVLGKTAAGRPLKIVVESHDSEAIITVAERDTEA